MSEESWLDRPRSVLVGVPLALSGSLLMVVSLFDTMSQTHSADLRSKVHDMLGSGSGRSLGISVDQMLSVVRGLVMFDAALAAATLVLAGYAFFRHRAARAWLTGLAMVLVLTGTVLGNPFPLLIGVGAGMLWSAGARDWFDGRTTSSASTRNEAVARIWQHGPVSAPTAAAARTSEPVAPPRGAVAPTVPLPQWPPPAYAGVPTTRRPASVTAAVVLTWVFAGLTAVCFLFVAGILLTDKQLIIQAAQRSPDVARLDLSANGIVGMVWTMCAVLVGWCLVAVVSSFFVLRRSLWGRVVLTLTTAAAIPISALVFPVGIVNVVAEVATLVLLFGGRANAWFAGRPSARAPRRPSGQVW